LPVPTVGSISNARWTVAASAFQLKLPVVTPRKLSVYVPLVGNVAFVVVEVKWSCRTSLVANSSPPLIRSTGCEVPQ